MLRKTAETAFVVGEFSSVSNPAKLFLTQRRNGAKKPSKRGSALRRCAFVIDEEGMVFRVLPVSTGNGELYMDTARSIEHVRLKGTFKVLRKINGWRLSSLGFSEIAKKN
jgi:hypothetical protein